MLEAETGMYIRFVIRGNDQDSGRRQGLFQAAAALRDAGALGAYEEEQLDVLRKWFSEHLERPESFSRSRKPCAKRVALNWLKDTARRSTCRGDLHNSPRLCCLRR